MMPRSNPPKLIPTPRPRPTAGGAIMGGTIVIEKTCENGHHTYGMWGEIETDTLSGTMHQKRTCDICGFAQINVLVHNQSLDGEVVSALMQYADRGNWLSVVQGAHPMYRHYPNNPWTLAEIALRKAGYLK